MPTHHPPEDWLLAHVCGSASEAIDLLVATHATLCRPCRERLRDLEDVAGAWLDAMEPEPMTAMDGLDALLADLPAQDPVPSVPQSAHNLPAPLLSYTGTDALPWSYVAPGVRQVALDLQHGELPVRLIRLRAGMTIPTHSHRGLERSLVLQGGYDDEAGTFVRGDLGVRDNSEPHRQRIHNDGPCIALVVNDSPITPVGLKSTVLSWFFSA